MIPLTTKILAQKCLKCVSNFPGTKLEHLGTPIMLGIRREKDSKGKDEKELARMVTKINK